MPRHVQRIATLALAFAGASALPVLPARAALPSLPPSHGHATVHTVLSEFGQPYLTTVVLDGWLRFGGRDFLGSVTVDYYTGNAVSSDGRLRGTCDLEIGLENYLAAAQAPAAADELLCTASIEGGKESTTLLTLVLPTYSQYPDTPYNAPQYDGSYGG
jgi:hypothetical protein